MTLQGYRAEIHCEVEAETKKQDRLHMAMATGVLWVKLDRDSSTQSRTMEDWPVAWSVWNTCRQEHSSLSQKTQEGPHNLTTQPQSLLQSLNPTR